MDQKHLSVLRAQAESLAKLQKGNHRGNVHLLAGDVALLCEVALTSSRFEGGADEALRNYLVTTKSVCEQKVVKVEQTQIRRGQRVDTSGVLRTLSMRDFATLVETACRVAEEADPRLNHGGGSGVAGDGAGELKVDPVREVEPVQPAIADEPPRKVELGGEPMKVELDPGEEVELADGNGEGVDTFEAPHEDDQPID